MKHFIISTTVLLLLVFFAGCSFRVGDFTLLSTKNVELGAEYEKVATAEAKDEIIVFFIPLGEPSIEKVVDKILDQNKGDLITNCVLSSYNYSFIFGVMGYQVKGDIWRRVSLSGIDPARDCYQLSSIGNKFYLVSRKEPVKTIEVK